MAVVRADIKIYAIIVAAGSGSRFGAQLPKQFCRMKGRPVVMTSIERVREAVPGVELRLVLSEAFIDQWAEWCREYGFASPVVVGGGSTRWESVRNAIESIPVDADRRAIVMVHDAARPLLTPEVATGLIAALEQGYDGAVPCVPVVDSIRRVFPDGRSEAVDRSEYRAVQTPQAFRLEDLREAYLRPFEPAMTDDASVMEAAGRSDIALVDGADCLMKITRPGDLDIVERML